MIKPAEISEKWAGHENILSISANRYESLLQNESQTGAIEFGIAKIWVIFPPPFNTKAIGN